MDSIENQEKKTMSSEQFYAGALLKFGWLDNIDMVILLDDVLNHSDITYTGKGNRSSEIHKYMRKEIDGGITALCPNYTFDTKVSSKVFGVITLRRKLEMMLNDTTKNYFDNIDLIWFVLKKIKYLMMSVGKSDLEAFNPLEQNIIFELLNQSLISRESDQEDEFDIDITQLGKLYVFKKDNKDLLEKFRMSIIAEGYSDADLDKYLLGQSLNRNISVILDLNRFKAYFRDLENNENVTRS